jgi:plasmid stability protein
MPSFTIRDVSDASAQALRERAAAAGKSTEAYIREWIEMQAQQAVIKVRYTLKATDESGARAHIRRDFDGVIGRGADNCNQEQYNAYKQAIDLVSRNEAGDREKAIGLLSVQFSDVFETA